MKQVMLKKVRGDMNPADLLTKHISGKDKVDQLVQLYGLVFMSGRAKAAPLLKRKVVEPSDLDMPLEDDLELCVIKDLDEDCEVVVPEASPHDPDVWPHLYSQELRETMFPTAVAAPEVEAVDPEAVDELGRFHRRWAAHRISVVRG